jgi:uncharacterized membrane protein (DUF106 family)
MRICLLLSVLFLVFSSEALAVEDCEQLKGCQAKICHLEQQIEMAKQHNNHAKLEGLNTALNEVRSHCTDASLKEKIQEDMDKVREDIEEYKKDLAEANAENKSDKISKYQTKISEKESDLHLLQKELEALQ